MKTKDWEWISCKRGKYLRNNLLYKNGFIHGFFSKHSQKDHPSQLISCLSERTKTSIHLSKQVHGNKIILASTALDNQLIEADGLISDKSRQSLWVSSADCIPILFADKKKGCVAACHSGWRGLAENILIEILKRLKARGSEMKDLIIAIGPAISKKRYEVGQEVIDRIGKRLKSKTYPANNELDKSLIDKTITNSQNIDKFLLDIRLVALRQLIEHGIGRNQISVNSLCTYDESNDFHSWRRDKLRKIQWSGILSKY